MRLFISATLILWAFATHAQEMSLTLSQGGGTLSYKSPNNFSDLTIETKGFQQLTSLDYEWCFFENLSVHCGVIYAQRQTTSRLVNNDPSFLPFPSFGSVAYKGEHLQIPFGFVYQLHYNKTFQPFLRVGMMNALVIKEFRTEYGVKLKYTSLDNGLEGDTGIFSGIGAKLNHGDWGLTAELRMTASSREIPTINVWYEFKSIPEIVNERLPTSSLALLVGVHRRF